MSSFSQIFVVSFKKRINDAAECDIHRYPKSLILISVESVLKQTMWAP